MSVRRLKVEQRARKRRERVSDPEPQPPTRPYLTQGARSSSMPSLRRKRSIDDAIRDAAGELHRPRWIRIS